MKTELVKFEGADASTGTLKNIYDLVFHYYQTCVKILGYGDFTIP